MSESHGFASGGIADYGSLGGHGFRDGSSYGSSDALDQ